MSRRRVMWTFAAICLAWSHTDSIAGIPTPVELLDLVAENPLMDQARALTDIVEARAEGVLSKTGPRIRFTTQAKRFQSMNRAESRDSDILSRIEVVRPLYDFGRRSRLIDAARADVRESQATVLSVRNSLMVEALTLYYELHVSDLKVQALHEDNTIAFFRASRLLEKDTYGLANPIEVVDMQAKAEKARYDYYSARSRNAELRLHLAELAGVPFGETTLAPVPPKESTFVIDAEKILVQAQKAHPELNSLRRRREALTVRQDITGLRPIIEAFGSVAESTLNSRGRENWALGARLVLPLYEGGRTQAEKARHEAEIRHVEAAIEARRRALKREVMTAVQGRNDSLLRIRASRKAYRAMRQHLYLEQLQRTQGRKASIGSLSARLTHIESELAGAVGAYHIAGARIAALIGLHPRDSYKQDFLEGLQVVP